MKVDKQRKLILMVMQVNLTEFWYTLQSKHIFAYLKYMNHTGVIRGKNMLTIIFQNKAIKYQQYIRILLDKTYWKVFDYSKNAITKLLFFFLFLFLFFPLFLCPLRRSSLCISVRQIPCLCTCIYAHPTVLSLSLMIFDCISFL